MPTGSEGPPQASGAPQVVARCPTCGLRVARASGCPEHGPLPLAEPEGDEAPADGSLDVPGYRISHLLGRGGFGAVFAAERLSDGLGVALKVANGARADAGPRLQKELEALRHIGPPHVPEIHDAGVLADGRPYIAMTLVAAPTLGARLLAAKGPLPRAELAAIARGLLHALAGVHARGYVHRDIKPDNLFIDDRFQVILIDLGIVAAADRASTAQDLTQEGVALGSVEYMAPEQCEGRRDIGASADIYAVGVVLYELLTGHPPFWGAPAAVRESHQSLRPARFATVAGVPRALEEVVLRCLAKAPEDRFSSVAELGAALDRALAEVPLTTAPAAPQAASQAALAPASTSSGATAAASAVQQERQLVSVVFFESDAAMLGVRRQVEALQGKLVSSAGRRYVALYDHVASENPVRSARRAAMQLVQGGVCQKAIVDLLSVRSQVRPDGSRRFLSTQFSRADRYPSAESPAGVTLTAAAAAVLRASPGTTDSTDQSAPPATRARPALFGRDDLLASLLAGARKTEDERVPRLISVLGEAGHGKSELCQALSARLRAQHPDAVVLEISAQEVDLADHDQTLRALLQRVLDLPAALPPGERPAVAPVLAMALGWLTPAAPELAALQAAPGALRSALIAATGEALRARAVEAPTFVVLDDAHLADQATLSALEVAALAEAAVPLWICVAARPAFVELRPSWGERAGHREAYTLGPLDPESAAALCRALLLPIDPVPDAAVARLCERAQRIPLLLVELVRGLLREGMMRRHPESGACYLATDELDRLPDLPVLEWLSQRKLARLPASLKAHARLLALLSPEVTPAEVEGVLAHLDRQGAADEFPLDAKIGTRRLLGAKVLVQGPNGRIRFADVLLRQAFVRAMPEASRLALQLVIFAYYHGDAGAVDEQQWLPKIAYHAAQAGLGEIAESAYVSLAEQARARHDYLEAEALYSRALEQSPTEETPLRGRAHWGRGLMRYRIGRYADALEDFARARERAITEGNVVVEIELLLDEAIALDWMRLFNRAEERAEQARARLAGVESPLLAARLDLALGRAHYRQNRASEAEELLSRAARAAAALGDEGYETLVIALMMRGFNLMGFDRLDEARESLDRAIALCEAHGDSIHLMSCISNRALLRALLGDKEGMTADSHRVIAMARESGNATMEWVSTFNLGEGLYWMDDVEAAAPVVQRALALDEERRSNAGRMSTLLLQARLDVYRGREEVARALIERIREHQAEARAAGRDDDLLPPSEAVLWTVVDLALGDASADAWDALIARSTECSVGQERIEVLEMRALAAERRGRLEEARRYLEQALAAAAQIPNMMGARLARRLAELSARRSA